MLCVNVTEVEERLHIQDTVCVFPVSLAIEESDVFDILPYSERSMFRDCLLASMLVVCD